MNSKPHTLNYRLSTLNFYYLCAVKKIKQNIPNALTCGNLLCGCIAIVKVFEGDLVWAAYLVGIAAIFDFFDGFAARMLKVSSPIGKDLDSLADAVTFGVVPGMVMFQLLRLSFNRLIFLPVMRLSMFDQETDVRSIICYIAFLIPIFSVIRLAKFNNDPRQSDSFIGVPTPANAIFICSLGLLVMNYNGLYAGEVFRSTYSDLILNTWYLILVTCLMSFLLVAELPLFALKFKNFKWADNKIRYIFLISSIVLLVCFQYVGIPIVIFLYVVFSLVNNLSTKQN